MDSNMKEEAQNVLIDFSSKRNECVMRQDILNMLLDLLRGPGEVAEKLEKMKQLLRSRALHELQEIDKAQRETEEPTDKITEWRSFLSRSRLQKVLAVMLQDISENAEYLKVFIEHFAAYNECIEPQYLQLNAKIRELDAPLHCAVRQLDGNFLDWLLDHHTINVNLRNRDKETGLALLCVKYDECRQHLNDSTVSTEAREKIMEELAIVQSFMRKLLAKGADFNIYTKRVGMPFELLWKYYGKDTATTEFVDRDILPRTGAIAISKLALSRSKAKTTSRSVELINETADNVRITVELLEFLLRLNDTEKFKKYWKAFKVTSDNVKKVITLVLHTAVDQSLTDSVEQIIEKASALIFKHDHTDERMYNRIELKGLLKTACFKGNPNMLKTIIYKMCDPVLLNEVPLLVVTVNRAHRAKNGQESADLLACAKILIENHKKVRLHAAGSDGNTALHLALRYGYEKLATLMLNQQPGLLAVRNRQNLTPVDCGTLQFWESYLDNCITMKERTSLRLDVSFLRPLAREQRAKANSKITDTAGSSYCDRLRSCVDSWNILQPVKEVNNSKCLFAQTVTDMTSLRLIAESQERQRLLMHPTLMSFITLKWKRLWHWNCLNLLLTLLTALFFGAYLLTSCSTDGSIACLWSLRCLSAIGALLMLIREGTQWRLLGWSYITLENVVDVLTCGLIGGVVLCGCERGGMCAHVTISSSFVIVSLALQASFLLGALSFSKLATIIYMFQTVSKNFFYSFLFFTPLISAFVYGFYLTNNESPNAAIDQCSSDDCSEKNFNNFRSLWTATVKTLVMTTGEFEAANVSLDGGKVLLFLSFLFLAPMVILNLINGIAVSDIAAIREQSEVISIRKKVLLLERYERGVGNSRFKLHRRMRRFLEKPFFPRPFFEEHEPTLYVVTSELNKLGLTTTNDGHTDQKPTIMSIPVVPWLPKRWTDLCINFRTVRTPLFVTLDQSYVNQAMDIVAKRYSVSSADQTLDLAGTGVGVKSPTKDKTPAKRQKLSNPAEPATERQEADPRDIQIKQLQDQLANIVNMIGSIKQDLQTTRNCSCGDQ